MAQVSLPIFIGDDRDPKTKMLMTWLLLKDFPIKSLGDIPTTPDYIPVVHSELIRGMVVTTWPHDFIRPDWCADKERVLLFRQRALSGPPQETLIEAIHRLVALAKT